MSARVQAFGRRDDETDHALKRPATKKRQGTKSRPVGQWLAASADRVSALPSMLGAAAAPEDGHLGGHAECIKGRSVD
jgi:hypothetical protein